MVIRVTKQGRLPEEEVFTGTCYHCKTEFECQRKDGDYHEDQRDGASLKVKCPFCRVTAFAYKAKGGSLIPQSRRSDYSWQIDAPVFPR